MTLYCDFCGVRIGGEYIAKGTSSFDKKYCLNCWKCDLKIFEEKYLIKREEEGIKREGERIKNRWEILDIR